MQKFLLFKSIFGKSFNILGYVIEYTATFLLIVAVLLILLQIFLRNVLGVGSLVPWALESVTICNLFLTYLGATMLTKDKKHISLRLHEKWPEKAKKFTEIFISIIVLFTSYLVIIQSINLVKRQLRISLVTLPFLTRGHLSLIITISFTMIIIYTLINFVKIFKKGK